MRSAWGELTVSHSAASMMSACSLLSKAADSPCWSTDIGIGTSQLAAAAACPSGRLLSSFGLRSTWVAFCKEQLASELHFPAQEGKEEAGAHGASHML